MDNTGLGVSGGNTKTKTNVCRGKISIKSGRKKGEQDVTLGYPVNVFVWSVPWVDFIDWNVQACGDVLHSLVALRDDTHTLSNGLSCDWVITSYHDDLGDGNI